MATVTRISTPQLELPYDRLAEFCTRWNVQRLSVFGSVLRENFSSQSDVDFLVEFTPSAIPSLWEQMAMEAELAQMLGRSVDMVDRAALDESRNWIRRQEILSTARVVYDS
jgi:uncharacterized protein